MVAVAVSRKNAGTWALLGYMPARSVPAAQSGDIWHDFALRFAIL
jgi:hypothetical protein